MVAADRQPTRSRLQVETGPFAACGFAQVGRLRVNSGASDRLAPWHPIIGKAALRGAGPPPPEPTTLTAMPAPPDRSFPSSISFSGCYSAPTFFTPESSLSHPTFTPRATPFSPHPLAILKSIHPSRSHSPQIPSHPSEVIRIWHKKSFLPWQMHHFLFFPFSTPTFFFLSFLKQMEFSFHSKIQYIWTKICFQQLNENFNHSANCSRILSKLFPSILLYLVCILKSHFHTRNSPRSPL